MCSVSDSETLEDCVSVSECKRTQMKYSLPQSNKGENGDVITHTNNEDEPQGEGEIFHISQLDHLT